MDVLDRLEQELKHRSIGAGRSSQPFSSPLKAAIHIHPVEEPLVDRLEAKLAVLSAAASGDAGGACDAAIGGMAQLRSAYNLEKRALELNHSAQLSALQERSHLALQRRDQQCAEALERLSQVNQDLRRQCLAAEEQLLGAALENEARCRRHSEEACRLRELLAAAERETHELRAEKLARAQQPQAPDVADRLATDVGEMWVRRVSELHVENERLAAEIVAARAAQDHAAGEKAELERQFAAYRRVSEQRLAAATAEAAAASKGRDDIMAEVVAAERRAKDQEAVAELLESRVRALLDERSVAEASRVSSSQCAASSPESRAPEVTTEPAGVAFPDNKGTIRRLVPKRLPQPRSAD